MDILKRILFEGAQSERLVLRPVNLNDIDDMYEYTSCEETCRFLSWGPYTDRTQVAEFIKRTLEKYQNPHDIVWGIEEKSNNKLIGVIRIYNINDGTATLSYILNKAYTGKGYMTETVKCAMIVCFDKLGCERINADFVDENIASGKVMARCGMLKKSDTAKAVIKGKEYILITYEREKIK